MEFWKKENGDRSKINSPILSKRCGLKLSHQSYLTHLNAASSPWLAKPVALCQFPPPHVALLPCYTESTPRADNTGRIAKFTQRW